VDINRAGLEQGARRAHLDSHLLDEGLDTLLVLLLGNIGGSLRASDELLDKGEEDADWFEPNMDRRNGIQSADVLYTTLCWGRGRETYEMMIEASMVSRTEGKAESDADERPMKRRVPPKRPGKPRSLDGWRFSSRYSQMMKKMGTEKRSWVILRNYRGSGWRGQRRVRGSDSGQGIQGKADGTGEKREADERLSYEKDAVRRNVLD
jgi:hypothetical protein